MDCKRAMIGMGVVAVTTLLAFGIVVRAQELPAGPGQEQTLKACGGCHGIGQIVDLKRSAEEWSSTVTAMINLGAPVPDSDFDAVVNYLATYLGTSPPPASPPPATPAAQ